MMSAMNDLLISINSGCDGLIREIKFNSFDTASITISAMKYPEKRWVNIRFMLSEVKEFTVRQKLHYSNVVISNGIAYDNFSGLHYIDFSPYSEIMANVDDFRASDLYFAAVNIDFKVLSYCE